jgi:hypothetical protein
VPVWSSILSGSILLEDVETRWLWTVMLVLADENRDDSGHVDCPVERLAQIANLTVEQTRSSLARLCAPDEQSRSNDEGGRRLIEVQSGLGGEPRRWRLVNWEKYKTLARRRQVAAAVRRYKARQGNQKVIKGNRGSSKGHSPSPSPSPSPYKKEEIRGFAQPALSEVVAYAGVRGCPEATAVKFHAYYTSNGWKVGKNPMKNWKAAFVSWTTRDQ